MNDVLNSNGLTLCHQELDRASDPATLLISNLGGVDTANHITDSKLILIDGTGHNSPDALLE